MWKYFMFRKYILIALCVFKYVYMTHLEPFKYGIKTHRKYLKKKNYINGNCHWILLESTYQNIGYDEVTSCDLTKRIQNHKEYSIHVVINQCIT